MKAHEDVEVHMMYKPEEMAVTFKMRWRKKGYVIERDVSFYSYEITKLSPEELTTNELEAMFIEGGGYK